nr:effector-associated domain EAD1-containing protein [Azospirillum formosense]
MEDNFPIALDRGGAKSAAPAPAPHAPADDWKRIKDILVDLCPAGPQDQEIWARAGGDLSRLRLTGRGRVDWFAALRALRQGGGGARISADALIRAGLDDFPHYQDLQGLLGVL